MLRAAVQSPPFSDFLNICAAALRPDHCTSSLPRVARCAERIHPTPTFRIDDEKLHCETLCMGAKPVREVLTPGESAFHEPNLGHDYVVTSKWEGTTFVATRR